MNAATCSGCGDTHLCPGTNGTLHPGERLTDQIRRFTEAMFSPHPLGVIGTTEAWEAYQRWCTATGNVAYSQRRFIQAMTLQPGIRRVKRSTMRFAGITWKRAHNTGRHHAPEPALSR